MFVDDLDQPVLDPSDRHHLERALRLRHGDRLTLSDGVGRWRAARFGPELALEGPVEVVPSPTPEVVVALTPVKGHRPEWAVQKLTEMGVDAIWLLIADRSVVRWEGERAAHHCDRLRRVAREAAMQSLRCTLPTVRVGVAVAEALAADGVLAHPGGGPPRSGRPLIVGPEGGWSDAELAAAAGGTVGLGPTVLRAETAAVVAGSLLTALRAGTVEETGG